MLLKIYEVLWAAVILVNGLFAVTGNLTMDAWVVFGFFYFGLVFMGMISVLPSIVAHPELAGIEVQPVSQAKEISPAPAAPPKTIPI